MSETVKEAAIIVHDWNCQCSACGYGGTSWTWMCSPGREDFKPIMQDSEECPGCGVTFTARTLGDETRRLAPSYLGDAPTGDKSNAR